MKAKYEVLVDINLVLVNLEFKKGNIFIISTENNKISLLNKNGERVLDDIDEYVPKFIQYNKSIFKEINI